MKTYRDIKYNYSEWTTHNGKKASGYSCEAFNHHPYHVQLFSTELEQDMITQIDEYIDNRDKYEARREQTNKAAKEFYNSMGEYKGD